MRHTAEEVAVLKSFALAHNCTERWARVQRARNTAAWQDFTSGCRGDVAPECSSGGDEEGNDKREILPGGAALTPLDIARARLVPLRAIADAALVKAESAAKSNEPQANVSLPSLTRSVRDTNKAYNEQVDRVQALEREAGLFVPIEEVEGLSILIRALGDTLREARAHLASLVPPESVPDLYRAWNEWARTQWNPAVRRRGETVARPSRFLDGLLLADPPKLSEWVQGLTMPVETSPNSPGKISLERTPYMAEPLDATMDPELEHLYLDWAAQTGKTTLCILALAGKIEYEPGPMLWALPSDKLAHPFSAGRLQPFILANPQLRKHVRANAPSAMNPMDMRLDNMPIYMTGTASPARLSSRPIPFAIIDEEAKMDQVDRKEAHPVHLIVERTKAFSRRLIIHASTPNTEESPFWQEYLATDMRHYFMPCPHCGEDIEFVFTRETLVWDDTDDLDIIERTAHYVCPKCKGKITDSDKETMMRKGHWVATNPRARRTMRGYHINTLYSPFVTFGEFAVEFVRSATDMWAATRLQNFKNSWEALPYIPYTSRVDDDMVLKLRDPAYQRGQLPIPDPYYIIVAYDPGETETHWLSAAVSKSNVIYVLDWGSILGIKTDRAAGQIGIADHFTHYRVEGRAPSIGFVDSGYGATLVYDECRQVPGLHPTKGAATHTGSWSCAPVRSHPGLEMYSYSDYAAKTELYAETIARGTGREIHLPASIDDALKLGLSGQMLVTGQHGRSEWRRLPNDHLGDCLKLCLVSMWVCGRVNPLLPNDETSAEDEPVNA